MRESIKPKSTQVQHAYSVETMRSQARGYQGHESTILIAAPWFESTAEYIPNKCDSLQ